MKNLLLRTAAALMLFVMLSAIASVPSSGAFTGDELALGGGLSAAALAVGEAERNREVEQLEETTEEIIGFM